jgi:hypothetical protein
MSDYSVTTNERRITVTQTRRSLLALGAAFILGASATLYLWWRDRSFLTDTESLVLLFISAGVICGGLWSVMQPFSFLAEFDPDSEQFFARWKGLRGIPAVSYPYSQLRTITVKETDDEGTWYTPQIRLDNGDDVELGFGSPTRELAEDLTNQLLVTSKARFTAIQSRTR